MRRGVLMVEYNLEIASWWVSLFSFPFQVSVYRFSVLVYGKSPKAVVANLGSEIPLGTVDRFQGDRDEHDQTVKLTN